MATVRKPPNLDCQVAFDAPVWVPIASRNVRWRTPAGGVDYRPGFTTFNWVCRKQKLRQPSHLGRLSVRRSDFYEVNAWSARDLAKTISKAADSLDMLGMAWVSF